MDTNTITTTKIPIFEITTYYCGYQIDAEIPCINKSVRFLYKDECKLYLNQLFLSFVCFFMSKRSQAIWAKR